MAKRTKQEALETRQAILVSAIDVFYDKGVAGASLNEIAEHAGVSRGAIYWHFNNKLDIFHALYEQLHGSVMDTVLQDLETDHPEPLQQLESLCVAILQDMETDTSKAKMLSILFMKCDYSGDMEVFLHQQNDDKIKSIALFSRYFERAKEQHHLSKDVDCHTLTLSLSFFLTGILHEHVRNPSLFSLAQQSAKFMRQFFQGVNGSAAAQ
jgi:AcrR family transcriptional regulator